VRRKIPNRRGRGFRTGSRLRGNGKDERKIIRLGGASGFWGDTPEGARQLVYSGQVDYLVMDYLAEITMSLLARAKAKDPAMGYPPDFVSQFIAPTPRKSPRAASRSCAMPAASIRSPAATRSRRFWPNRA
jgi:hypothetical protein